MILNEFLDITCREDISGKLHNKQQNAINVNGQVAPMCIDKYFGKNQYKAESQISGKKFHLCAHSCFSECYPAGNILSLVEIYIFQLT